MKKALNNILVLLVLLLLCFSKHNSTPHTPGLKIWEVLEGGLSVLAFEEDLDGETERCSIRVRRQFGSERYGDGGPTPILLEKLSFEKEAAEPKFLICPPLGKIELAIEETQATAFQLAYLNRPKSKLFLLFHNIKSDPTHTAA